MRYVWWTDYLSFVHLCLIKQHWREENTVFADGVIYVKMVSP